MVNPVLRNLPSVNELLESPALKGLLSRVSQNAVVARVRAVLDDVRREVQSAAADARLPNVTELAERIARRIVGSPALHALRPIINATGTVFEPGLGGAPLADEAVAEAAGVARDYLNLEVDLRDGAAANRAADVEALLCELTGAEAALVVNSHAAGTLLALAALAEGREMIVSRGQILEIEPGYRLPELAAAAGAALREVGTTNHTRLEDYSAAVDDRTAGVLVLETPHVVPGQTPGHVALDELIELARTHKLPLIHDLGDATLIDLAKWDVHGGRRIGDSVASGAELTLAAGDQAIGGPQCGLIVGRRASVERLARHALARASQPDKIVLAALAGTLRLYRDPLLVRRSVPVVSLLAAPLENLKLRAERLAPRMAQSPAVAAAVPLASPAVSGRAATWCVALSPQDRTAEQLSRDLLATRPPVLTRLEEGRVLVDLRSVLPRQDQQLVSAVLNAGGLVAAPTLGD